MAIKYLNAAFNTKNLSVSEKFVLVCIADYCDEYGCAYPSLSTLMQRTGLSRQGMINCIATLLRRYLICKIDNSYIPAKYLKRKNQNCYQINYDPVTDQWLDPSTLLTGQVQEGAAVKTVDLIHQDNPQKENLCELAVLAKQEDLPTLTDALLSWGLLQPQAWSAAEMEQHFAFFCDYLKNRKNGYKDWQAAFRNCVRSNWAAVKRSSARYSKREQISRQNAKALAQFLQQVEEQEGSHAEIEESH